MSDSEKKMHRALLPAFFFSGAAALIYEVVWTRALSLVLGSTVYALSTMLATFMAGLAIGGYLGGKLADRSKDLVLLFASLELGIGAFGLISVPLTYSLPPLYFWIYKTFHLMPVVFFAIQFVVCFLIMIVPTTLMGATFPVVSRRLTPSVNVLGKSVGNAYSVNTIGAMLGSLAAGFLLMPFLGIKMTSFVAAALNILMGGILIVLSGRRVSGPAALAFVILFSGIGVMSYSMDGHPGMGSFYYIGRTRSYDDIRRIEENQKVVYEKDHAEGTVRAFVDDVSLTIQHGGKLEGTSPIDFTNAFSSAVIPAAAHQGLPEEMLVIGLGAGVTAWAASQVAGHVDVVEINPGVVEVVRRFGIPGTLENATIYLDDARRRLFLSEKKYDVVTAEPSVPSESTAANLYTREFYDIVLSRLKPGGIFGQWFPGWAITRRDARICVKTFASVFQDVYLWHIPVSNDFIMIGSNGPVSYGAQEIIQKAKEIGKLPEYVLAGSPSGLLDEMFSALNLVRDPAGIGEIIAMKDIPIMTDDKPYLEFAVTRNLLYGPEYFKKYRE